MNIPVRHAMIIPQQSTYEVQDQKYVFVVDGSGVVHARPIKVAYEKQGVYVISSGLTGSDRFVFDGVEKVNDGDHIATRYKTPADAMQAIKLTAN
jgi:membrane fusion protein (multidrug efflux system)